MVSFVSWVPNLYYIFVRIILYPVTDYPGKEFIANWTSKTDRLLCSKWIINLKKCIYACITNLKKNIKTLDCSPKRCEPYIWIVVKFIQLKYNSWLRKNMRNDIPKYWNASFKYYRLYLHVHNITDVFVIMHIGGYMYIYVVHILNQSLVLVTLSLPYIHCHNLQFHHNKIPIKQY